MKCSWMLHTHLLKNSEATCISKNALKQNQNKKPQKTLSQTVISIDMWQETLEFSGHDSMSIRTYKHT